MKRFKLICSAIAALSMLALAGCDLEKMLGEKIELRYIMSGTIIPEASVKSFEFFFYPVYGDWESTAVLDDIPNELESLEGKNVWWTERTYSKEVTVGEGGCKKLEFKVTGVSGDVFTPVFGGRYNSGEDYYFWIDPVNGLTQEDPGIPITVENETFEGTAFKKDVTYTFTLEWEDDVLTYTFL